MSANAKFQTEIQIPNNVNLGLVLGPQDKILNDIQKKYPTVRIDFLGNSFKLTSEDSLILQEISSVIYNILNCAQQGRTPSHVDINNWIRQERCPEEAFEENVILYHQGKAIKPKTNGQAKYATSIENSTITICKSVAGTGKTFIAVAEAVGMLKAKDIEKIIITRPAVPAYGEDLGALPGAIDEKMDPYIQPIIDAMNKMISADKLAVWFDKKIIEVCPLAFMRGRTFDNAFVIADEMQNSVPEQAEMLLSRLGENTKCVIEGDPFQQDKKYINANGLENSIGVLKDIDDVSIVEMDERDVVRSEIASKVVAAYKEYHLSHK